MSPEDAMVAWLDAKANAVKDGEPELVVIGYGAVNHAVIWAGTHVRPWEYGSAVLRSLASWAPPEGLRVTITTSWKQPTSTQVFIFHVTVTPANVSGFDLQAAYLEEREKRKPVTVQQHGFKCQT